MVLFSHLFTSVVALAGVVPGAWCSQEIQSETSALEVRQSGFFPITGVQEGGSAPRLEIRQLQKRRKQWNLFIQAMERLQHEGQGKESSYYSISAIHGKPTPWDGVGGSGGAGYCPHSSNLFGPWHRPYLALIEQRLHSYAVQIANDFPAGTQRNAYRNAARTLRLPYWDWALPRSPAIPQAITNSHVSVRRPSGRKVRIPNPLFAYRFHPLNPGDFGGAPQSQWQSTKRFPQGTGPDAKSNEGQVVASFNANVGSYRSRVYNLFARKSSYNHFSNLGSGSRQDTLEGIHNNIHSGFGPNSHMSIVPFSAYDPVFFLHHCNVDRILALWQHLYPKTYVKSHRQSQSTYTIAAGSVQGVNSPLTPFHRNKQGQFWTPKSARGTKIFGYTYPELRGKTSRRALRRKINRLYGSRVSGVSGDISQQKIKARDVQPRTLNDLVSIDFNFSPDDILHEYVAKVTMPINPLGNSYSAAVFLGDFNRDPSTWLTEPNYIGSNSVLGMANQVDTETMVTAQIVLTQPLLNKFASGELESLDMETVLAYLKKNLKWHLESNGQSLRRSEVPGVSVEVVSTNVKPPTDEGEFPTFLDTTKHLNVTDAADMDMMF
jgi:tyrosinase